LTLRRHFGDNEGVIELNPHGAEAPLPLVKQGGENIWATVRGDPGEAGENRFMSEYERIYGIYFGEKL
jgi:hypothetical protein